MNSEKIAEYARKGTVDIAIYPDVKSMMKDFNKKKKDVVRNFYFEEGAQDTLILKVRPQADVLDELPSSLAQDIVERLEGGAILTKDKELYAAAADGLVEKAKAQGIDVQLMRPVDENRMHTLDDTGRPAAVMDEDLWLGLRWACRKSTDIIAALPKKDGSGFITSVKEFEGLTGKRLYIPTQQEVEEQWPCV